MGAGVKGGERSRIIALDGLRGCAVLSVLAYHFVYVQITAPIGSLFYYFRAPLKLAWSGVDLFFVLSGFLITDILIKEKGSPRYFRAFYARRITRIFPVYFLVLVTFYGARATLPNDLPILADPKPWWSYVLFIQNIAMWLDGNGGALWLGPTWSLAVEEQFYLIVPLIVLWLPRRTAIAALIFLAAMAPVLRYLNPGPTAFMVTAFRTDSLLFGSLLAYAMQSGRFVRACRERIRVIYGLLGVACAMTILMMARREWFEPFDFTLLSTAFLMLILAVQIDQDGLLARALRAKLLLWFGAMSYAIYMFHEAVLGLTKYIFLGMHSAGFDGPASIAVTALAFALTCALAALSARYFEGPIRRFGQRWRY